MYNKEKAKAKREKKRMRKGRLAEIISSIEQKRNLPVGSTIKESLVRKRITRGKSFITTKKGLQSPLLAMENLLVRTIIQMARVRQCLTPSQGVALVNSMIEGTQIKTKLMNWKKKYSQGSNLR